MKNFKKLLSLFLVIAVVLSMAAVLTACGKGDDATDPTGGDSGEKIAYSVNVQSAGGMKLEGIEVYVYADDTLADMKDYGETDENGQVTFELTEGSNYAIALSSVPKGYAVAESYAFSGKSADIELTSSLVADESLSGATLGLGDVMYDFSVVLPDGGSVTLSEMLAEKKMVLLNFWFSTCGPCANEFPYMEEAYQMYKDDVGIIALDPLEDNSVVGTYQNSMGLTFPMASCTAAWSQTFGISGYPTSVVVDRYGVICLIEVGGITSLRPFTSIFEHFTAEDYEQKICYNGAADVITTMKPTHTMPSSDEIAAVINNGEIEVTYRAEEGEGAEYCWPFIIGEKNGEACIYASNQQIEGSYAIVYADVTLKAGQAVGFDYLISSEQGADSLIVIVEGEDIFQMSGVDEMETWKGCYPWVADEDGTYEVALCYLKDEATNAGDDTVYVKNLRVVAAEDIDAETYLPREAAVSEDGFEYTYAEIVYNDNDGYYHVGSANGPLLLASLMNYTQFNEEKSVWEMAYNGELVVDGHNYLEELETYCNYASNTLPGVCTVNQELADLLKIVDQAAGFDSEDDNEWLKICKYYQVYGSDKQLEDPIAGLATFSAYTAKEGKNVESNYFYYDRIIMPRGLLAEFVPSKSGVYRITSRAESTNGVDAWIFDKDHNELLVYEMDERMYNDSNNVSMVYYMKAGEPYYIDIAFWDPYEVGYIYYDIEYLGSSREHFRLCSPGYFTYDTNATGDAMYHLIAGGIDVVLGSDGIYREDLGNGNTGSKIYADFVGVTSLFSNPIATVDDVKGMIDMGGFDFSKTDEDLYILGIIEQNDNDVTKADAYLKELWGEEYDGYAEIYQLEDVYAGRYHGTGEDLTEEMRGYLDDMITSGGEEVRGCVEVTERLAEILTMLMDKYTFENVDNSWIKLCYYYDYLGPEG